MKSIKILMAITVLLSGTACIAQIKNSKTETVKIYGNCGMCETNIEKAGSIKKIAKVDWNKDTKMAIITYDAKKTNQDEILKRIALAGYDNDKYYAPDDVYDNLHGCCQYERPKQNKASNIQVTTIETSPNEQDEKGEITTSSETNVVSKEKEITPKSEGTTTNAPSTTIPIDVHSQKENHLKLVFDQYFALKDALVLTNPSEAAKASGNLLNAIEGIDMTKLGNDEHLVWMKVLKDIKAESKSISESQDIDKQRNTFISLSTNMYDLMKAAKYESDIYYQFCPMANDGKGAKWLSKEKNIKNPYYGNEMLTCGKVVEVIKQ